MKTPGSRKSLANTQTSEPLSLNLSAKKEAQSSAAPSHLEGIQTVTYDPSKTLLIAVNITGDDFIGQTELLTQSYGHGAKKDIRASITFNTVEEGRIVQKQKGVRAGSGPVMRHTIAGHITQILSESKVLNI